MTIKQWTFAFFLSSLLSCGTNPDNSVSTATTVPTDTTPNFSDTTVARKYFASLSQTDIISEKNWSLLNRQLEDYDFTLVFYNSKAFPYLISHRTDFEKLYTTDSVQSIICRVYEFALKDASSDKDKFEQIKKDIYANTGTEADRIIQHVAMSNYFDSGDFDNYSKIASKYVDKYCQDNEGQLNWSAWQFYEHVDNKAYLQKALTWSKRAMQLSDSYSNMDTYAHLLYKLGQFKEAKSMTEKAIEKAKQDKQDYQSSTDLLKKIK